MPDKRSPSSPRAAQLQQLADQEAASLRERHKARDAAIRQYDTASAAIADADQLLARAKQDQANAIGTLLDSGLDVANVASVLGLDPRRVREARPAKRATATAPGAGNAPASGPAPSEPALAS